VDATHEPVAAYVTMADATAKTVTQISNDYGFGELGRFAVTYRKLFGIAIRNATPAA
jgi:AraC-like DNA-binding protein